MKRPVLSREESSGRHGRFTGEIGYLGLGQPARPPAASTSASRSLEARPGGAKAGKKVYVMDEPTTGRISTHPEDGARPRSLVDHGQTLVIIEHNPSLSSPIG